MRDSPFTKPTTSFALPSECEVVVPAAVIQTAAPCRDVWWQCDGTPCVVQLTAGRSSHVLLAVDAAVVGCGGAAVAPAVAQEQLAGAQLQYSAYL